MTDKQAWTQARKRWGKYAMVQKNPPPYVMTHQVGRLMLGLLFEVKGSGTNWVEAFANADRQWHGTGTSTP